jgi:hypothetical protein
MDFVGVHARRQHRIGEIHGLRLLTYEQHTRHLTLPRGCATLAEAADAHKSLNPESVILRGFGR